ncbi:MAG: GumC family protein [Candidatus Eiseniibacteriota bacterium]
MTLPPSRFASGNLSPLGRPPASLPDHMHRTGDLNELLRKLRRHLKLIVGCLAIATLAAFFVVSQLQARYSAFAQVQVGVPEPKVLSKTEAVMASQQPDAEVVRNESYVMASPAVAKAVIQKYGLDRDPEFNPALRNPSLWQRLSYFFQDLFSADDDSAPSPRDAAERAKRREDRVVNTVLSKVDVEPIARSYMLSIQADSYDPITAAKLANGFADAYVEQQRSHKWQATHDAEVYLKTRIATLQKQVEKSDQAVEDYRRRTGLLKGATAGVTEQQLTELNTQLILAQAAKAEADSKLSEALSLAKRANASETIPAVLQSRTIQEMKQQQIEVQRKIAELSSTYGEMHPKMQNARAEEKEIQVKIALEVKRIIAGLRNEAKSADARYETLRDNFARLKTEAGNANEKSIELQALDREATANRAMLEAMLARYKETVAQQDLVRADAQIIAPASVPDSPSFPPRILLIAVAALGGLGIGVLLAFLVENFDRTFRRPDDVEELTGLPTLALVPLLSRRARPAHHVLDKPVSPFSDALRRLYISLQCDNPGEPSRLIMIASAVPKEGKSVMCASLAHLLASSGRRVLLIDCDWRRPSQHRLFGVKNRTGLAQVLANEVSIENALHRDRESGAHVLFTGALRAHNLHLLNSEAMRELLVDLANGYDTVILDTPPVLVGAEVLHLSRLVDKTVFLARWGRTPREVALDALKQLVEAHGRVAGVVLSHVNSDRYRYYSYAKIDYGYSKSAFASPR